MYYLNNRIHNYSWEEIVFDSYESWSKGFYVFSSKFGRIYTVTFPKCLLKKPGLNLISTLWMIPDMKPLIRLKVTGNRVMEVLVDRCACETVISSIMQTHRLLLSINLVLLVVFAHFCTNLPLSLSSLWWFNDELMMTSVGAIGTPLRCLCSNEFSGNDLIRPLRFYNAYFLINKT